MPFHEIVRCAGQRSLSLRIILGWLTAITVSSVGVWHAGARAAESGVTGTGATAVATATLAPRYPGTIGLEIDLSDLDHKIMAVHQTIPVTPGHLVLLYPQWIPGSHSPIGNVATLTRTAKLGLTRIHGTTR